MMLQQQQMMQQQIMQEQMINQLNLDNIVEEESNKPKMNITFRFLDSSKLNLICDYGCSIKEVFDLLEKKIGKSKYNFNFSLNGKRLNHNDERIIEKTFPDGTIINAFEKEGFIWGGKWVIYDNMHFEYHPELIEFNLRK
jgi:hypothetical protein